MTDIDAVSGGAVEGLRTVRSRIAAAAQAAGRKHQDITLVAVSKTFGVSDIEPVIQAGQRVFGENRVQEAKTKWPELRTRHPGLELHLIGPLQTNKAAEAVALFDVIQTVDRPKLALALAAEMKKQGIARDVFIQVNTGREPQKAGIMAEDIDQFLRLCRDEAGLNVTGLMCIPPVDEPPEEHFSFLKGLADRLSLPRISMGMSGDFETAIALGATHVRVGSAIFGHRSYPTPP
jgi:hypothetical protein